MRRLFLLCGVLVCLLAFSGCAPELYERLLISAVGVDKTADGCRVTVRAAPTEENGQEQCYSGNGRSVPEALEQIAFISGKNPLYSHNTLVIFGMDCAEGGLMPYLDFFIRHYESRPTVHTFLSETTAEEILNPGEESDLVTTDQITSLTQSAEYTGLAVDADIIRLIHGTYSEGFGAALPIIRNENGVLLGGTALLKDLKLQCTLDGTQTRGLLVLSGKLKTGETILDDAVCGRVTVNLRDAGAEIHFIGTADAPRFSVTLNVQGEISSMEHDYDAGDTFARLETAFSEKVAENAEQYLTAAVLECGADAVGFGNVIFREAPDIWEELAPSWPGFLKNAEFDLTVNAVISRVEEEDLMLLPQTER